MSGENYTSSFTVDRTPDEVFEAINDVRAWWTGVIEGKTDELGAEFTYTYVNVHYSKQKITELVPGKRVVWKVTEAELTFIEDTGEWTGTEIVFDIAEKDGKTEVTFTHIGLVPEVECFTGCSDGWNYYVGTSLRAFINSGK
jgi:hypothetical protein